MNKFPKDCKDCPYYTYYDMSIDDYTSICEINGMHIDDCDTHFQSFECPNVIKPRKMEIKCSGFKFELGMLLLSLDDWLGTKHIYFDLFVKDKENHVSFLCRWGFRLVLGKERDK